MSNPYHAIEQARSRAEKRERKLRLAAEHDAKEKDAAWRMSLRVCRVTHEDLVDILRAQMLVGEGQLVRVDHGPDYVDFVMAPGGAE